MKKRNIILLIIIIATITIGYIWYSNFTKTNTVDQTGDSTPKFNFFPFGENKKTNTPATEEIPEEEVSGEAIVENNNKLKKVSSMPVAGYGIFNKEVYKEIALATPVVEIPPVVNTKDTKQKKVIPIAPATELVPTLRYVDKVTGNIYQSTISDLDERKFTDTIIPQIYEAFFGNNSRQSILRYLKNGKNIQSFIGILPEDILGADTTGDTGLKGTFLPENITDLSISPDGLKMFYLFNVNNSAVGIISNTNGDKKNQIFNSSFTEWLSSWSNNKTVTLTTKPGFNVPGYLYSIDVDKKDFKKIMGGINGLTTLTNTINTKVLYSASITGSVNLNIYHIDTNATDALSAKTLPEKCVWSQSDYIYCAVPKYIENTEYPDAWYQGLVSFSDEIWRIDTINNTATKIADPVAITGEEVDGIKLGLSNDENYLFFINKKDSYLWELNLK
ncbi:MAG: hypothetical protein V4504_01525 [Patescibacteria group bacterium]